MDFWSIGFEDRSTPVLHHSLFLPHHSIANRIANISPTISPLYVEFLILWYSCP